MVELGLGRRGRYVGGLWPCSLVSLWTCMFSIWRIEDCGWSSGPLLEEMESGLEEGGFRGALMLRSSACLVRVVPRSRYWMNSW